MKRPAITLCGLLLAFALLAPPRARAFTEACRYGVNAHQAQNSALDLVAAAGIGWVRFDMNWFQFEPSQGSFNWTEADRFFGHADSLGLHVFVTVAYTPEWAASGPCNDADPDEHNHCRNAVVAQTSYWTDFLTAALGRYSATVKHWGLWNEPNLLHFYRGTRDQWVSTILVPGANTVHNLCATCYVLGPELANLRSANWDSDEGVCIGNECAFNGWNYSLARILEVAGSHFDIITHHKYKDPATDFWSQMLDGEFIGVKIMDGVKEVIDQYGQGQPVWITEFGWESEPFGSHTNAYAASQLTAAYEGMAQIIAGTYPNATNQPWPELEKLFWYDLHDDPSGYSWGLLDSSLNVKDPYTAYAAVIQTLGDCTSTTPGPDAGVVPDGAVGADGATAADGAMPGADGQTPTVDARTPGADAAGDPTEGESGCSCRQSKPSTGLGLLLLCLGLLWRRRTA